MSSTATASFEEVKSAKDDKQVLVIDVREPTELQETGVIPGSINVPLGTFEGVLKDLSPEQFEASYGRPKPGKDFSIIVSCKLGGRSAKAQQIASKLGYSNVRNYQGGWADWEKKIQN